MNKPDILAHTLQLIRPLQQEVEAAVASMLSGTSITVRTRAVLENLAQSGPLTVPQVAARLGMKRQYVQIMMNEAEEAGFVRCRSNPAHKRSVLFELTKPGQDVLIGLQRAEKQIMQSVSGKLTRDEVEKAHHVIEHVLTGFRNLNKALKE